MHDQGGVDPAHPASRGRSDREFEIFQLVGQGKSTKDIAHHLNLSSKTVDVHRGHIKAKLELKDATSLVRHAVRWVETQVDDASGSIAGREGSEGAK